MTREERKILAEQLAGNPLIEQIMSELEAAAIDQCIYAALTDNDTRAFAAQKVQAIRSFRTDWQASLDSNRERKAAPA